MSEGGGGTFFIGDGMGTCLDDIGIVPRGPIAHMHRSRLENPPVVKVILDSRNPYILPKQVKHLVFVLALVWIGKVHLSGYPRTQDNSVKRQENRKNMEEVVAPGKEVGHSEPEKWPYLWTPDAAHINLADSASGITLQRKKSPGAFVFKGVAGAIVPWTYWQRTWWFVVLRVCDHVPEFIVSLGTFRDVMDRIITIPGGKDAFALEAKKAET